MAQSMLFSSHMPNRPAPISGGIQLMAALRASISSLNAVVRTNHDDRRVVEQLRAAAPAVRIRMVHRSRLPEHVAPLELLDDQRRGGLHAHAAHHGHVRRELAARVHRLQEREPVLLPRQVVVRAERGRHVHHAAAVVGGHEILGDDDLVRALRVRHPVQRTPVAQSRELRAPELRDDLPLRAPLLPEHRDGARFREQQRPVGAAVLADFDVRERRIHGERGVRQQRPRRRRPDDDSPAGRRARSALEIERQVDARIFRVLVALREFVRRERRAAARAVRQDLVPARRAASGRRASSAPTTRSPCTRSST